MPVEEFLTRLKMTNKVAKACRQKSEGIHYGKRVDEAIIQKTAVTIKNDCVRDGQGYPQFLISEVLRHAGLSSNIVKGLAAFDPFVMLRRPTEVAIRLFDMLYSTFLLRSWVTAANESTCRDDYVELLDDLRSSYAPTFDITQGSRDLIDFLMNLEFMQTNSHLLHLIKLCCLRATSDSPNYPTVTMGTLSTSGFHSRSTDVILPCQSYLAGVPGSLACCSSYSNLNSFSLISASFGQSAFYPTYDPRDIF